MATEYLLLIVPAQLLLEWGGPVVLENLRREFIVIEIKTYLEIRTKCLCMYLF